MIKLSVIIPIYNTPQHLLEYCLSRIQENLLSLKDTVEVLLINDGSTEPYIESTLKKASEADSLGLHPAGILLTSEVLTFSFTLSMH